MKKNRLIYLLMLIASFIFFNLYDTYFPCVLILFLVILPILLYILTIIQSFLTDIEITAVSNSYERNAPIRFNITVRNKMFIPLPQMRCRIISSNTFINSKRRNTFVTGCAPFSSVTQSFSLTSSHCGIIKVRVDNVKIYDIFRLTSKKLHFKKDFTITIKPEYEEIEGSLDAYASNNGVEDENISFSANVNRDNLLNVRKYTEGDSIRDIHWKLTAKLDNVMIKEYAHSTLSTCNILVELIDERNLESIDLILITLHSLMRNLFFNNCSFTVTWYNEDQNRYLNKDITTEDDIIIVLNEIINTPLYKERLYVLDDFIPDADRNYSNVFYIGSTNNLSQMGKLTDMYPNAFFKYIGIGEAAISVKSQESCYITADNYLHEIRNII